MKKKVKKGLVNTNKLWSSILTFFVNPYISKNHLILNYEALQNHDILQSFALIKKFHLIFIRVNICSEEYTAFLTIGGVFRTLSNIWERVSGKLPPRKIAPRLGSEFGLGLALELGLGGNFPREQFS